MNELVLKLLHRYIPLDLQAYIDFPSLSIVSDMHMDNKLKSSQSDSIHECKINLDALPEHIRNDTNLPTFRFCFLWEHKSEKPKEPIEFQVERYRYSIIHVDLKNGLNPSVIIPIIIYNGKEKWDKKMIYDRLSDYLPPAIMAYVSYPKYIFIDIQAMTEEEIEEAVDLGTLRSAFIALKHGHDKEFFKRDMKKVLKFVDDSSPVYLFQEFFKMLLEYMQRRSELEEKEFNDIVEQEIEPDMATKFKTIFEVAEERALEKGKVEGIAIGEEKGMAIGEAKSKETMHKTISVLVRTTSLTDAQIAEELDTDESLVKSIRQEVKALTKKKR